MSFQAYVDAAEARTGLPPQQVVDLATERGYGSSTRAGDILARQAGSVPA